MVYIMYSILFQSIRTIESEKIYDFYDFRKIVNFTVSVWKPKTKQFFKSVLEINRLPKKEPFAEMDSHIKPLALARLSAVNPLLKWNMKVN